MATSKGSTIRYEKYPRGVKPEVYQGGDFRLSLLGEPGTLLAGSRVGVLRPAGCSLSAVGQGITRWSGCGCESRRLQPASRWGVVFFEAGDEPADTKVTVCELAHHTQHLTPVSPGAEGLANISAELMVITVPVNGHVADQSVCAAADCGELFPTGANSP